MNNRIVQMAMTQVEALGEAVLLKRTTMAEYAKSVQDYQDEGGKLTYSEIVKNSVHLGRFLAVCDMLRDESCKEERAWLSQYFELKYHVQGWKP